MKNIGKFYKILESLSANAEVFSFFKMQSIPKKQAA
jgi:hypothetical protein